MGRMRQRVRSLGHSVAGVVRAEILALLGDLQHSGKGFGIVVSLITVAMVFVFWATGVGVATLVALLSSFLPVWGAAGIVFLVLALLAGILLAVAWKRLKRLEAPTQTVRRHLDDHLGWWQTQMVDEDGVRRGRRRPTVANDPVVKDPVVDDPVTRGPVTSGPVTRGPFTGDPRGPREE